MSGLILNGDTSGSVAVNVPAVAGTNTVTIPARTGNVMLDGPAFSAYASSGTTLTTTTVTKISFATKEFDTATCFDTSTSRFTPTVAGYYFVNVQFQTVAAIGGLQAVIRKNGSDFKNGGNQFGSATNGYGNGVSALVYLNGTTDYVEGCAFQWSGSNQTVATGQQVSYFQAIFMRGA